MAKITVKVEGRQLAELAKEIERVGFGAITPALAAKIGRDAIKVMKAMISTGLSPIRGAGRFPAYKATSSVSGGGRGRLKQISNKYPLNQRRNFPSKGLRPVNLKLSGQFLRALKSRVTRGRKSPDIEIGFFEDSESVKEKGHREGANSQPKRPIIPEGSEEFAIKVQKVIAETIEEAITKYLAKITKD